MEILYDQSIFTVLVHIYKACAVAFGGLILMKVFEVLKSVAGYSPERWQSFAELVAVAVVLFLFLHFYENMERYR